MFTHHDHIRITALKENLSYYLSLYSGLDDDSCELLYCLLRILCTNVIYDESYVSGHEFRIPTRLVE